MNASAINSNPLAGVLPLYLELYDDCLPQMRPVFTPFLERIKADLEAQGIRTVFADVCRLEPEVSAAVERFEAEHVDALVIIHLAYSPSLESIGPLANTRLPLLLLDTTMDESFGIDTPPERILYNHGIHGVQDLACMLLRRSRSFQIAAGHADHSPVLRRAAEIARGACAARRLHEAKTLRIGPPFAGMGDFAVEENILRQTLGISVHNITPEGLHEAARHISTEAIEAELAADRERFEAVADAEAHRRSVRVGLALRRVLEEGGYSAFSMNFRSFDSPEPPIDTVPFLEASKAMARGIGYAGEGDVLTAAFVGALARAFGGVTFTEIFCPDWTGQSLFLSHMGEINPDIAGRRARLVEKDFPWTPAHNPVIAACAPAPGPATLVNIAPGPNDTFTLIAAPVEVLED